MFAGNAMSTNLLLYCSNYLVLTMADLVRIKSDDLKVKFCKIVDSLRERGVEFKEWYLN